MSTVSDSRQLGLLLRLWWRHMRRRSTRVGEAPKTSGVPTFLLINLMSTGYMMTFAWRNVAESVEREKSLFAWHVLGVLCVGFAAGISKGVGLFQVRGTRNDSFLEALPLTLFARVGLSLADTLFVLPLTMIVPIAALSVQRSIGGSALPAVLLGPCAFIACFVVGQSTIAWLRALCSPAVVRVVSYVTIGLNVGGFLLLYITAPRFIGDGGAFFVWLSAHWLTRSHAPWALIGATGVLTWLAYRALQVAERRGFDRTAIQPRAPKRHRGVRDRAALEWQIMLRQGGRASLIVFSVMLLGLGTSVFFIPLREVPGVVLLYIAGFAIYIGVLQVITQAGRAARNDIAARAFLSALPLLPHQVLDGKAHALRKLLIPMFLLLALLLVATAFRHEWSESYRIALSLLALYVVASGAVSVSFLSSGIGAAAVAGAQPTSNFSTQLLILPLFAIIMPTNDWSATTALVAVCAVTWEARRAAKRSLRWLDDAADDLERETTVWRALLSATAFFTVQGLTAQLLSFFGMAQSYSLAIAYGSSSLLLLLLTWRNSARFTRPAFLPQHVAAWPIAALAGGASGMFALWLVKIFPPPSAALETVTTTGESIAAFATMVVVAPLVEEYFFRGWLQKAIETDLPDQHKSWAFAIGALVFALVHIGSYGVPQLVLGLIAGALYARGRGLLPGMLAHAIHNAVIVLVSS